MKEPVGYLHSVESFGAVDGPGVRFVVFLQGCPLRCLFCHNADTWKIGEGEPITPSELFGQIDSYRNFIQNGGVTFSGGEPLLQPEFLCAVMALCKETGLHTAIDTSGAVPLSRCREAVEAADLLLLDIKDIDTGDCMSLTGMGNENALELLRACEDMQKPVWIRHVLVPGYTLQEEKLHRLGKELSRYTCIERVELSPFHKMGEYKWEFVDQPYQLGEVPLPSKEEIEKAREILKHYELSL